MSAHNISDLLPIGGDVLLEALRAVRAGDEALAAFCEKSGIAHDLSPNVSAPDFVRRACGVVQQMAIALFDPTSERAFALVEDSDRVYGLKAPRDRLSGALRVVKEAIAGLDAERVRRRLAFFDPSFASITPEELADALAKSKSAAKVLAWLAVPREALGCVRTQDIADPYAKSGFAADITAAAAVFGRVSTKEPSLDEPSLNGVVRALRVLGALRDDVQISAEALAQQARCDVDDAREALARHAQSRSGVKS